MRLTIGDVSAQTGIPAPTLRYYDKEGLLPFVGRNKSGMRVFTEDDLEWLHMIECLKRSGLSIKEIKEFVDLYVQGDSTLEQRRDIFYRRKAAVEQEMARLKQTLDFVTYKCWYYDTAVAAGTIKAPQSMQVCDMPSQVQRYKKEHAAQVAERNRELKAVSGGETGRAEAADAPRTERLTA